MDDSTKQTVRDLVVDEARFIRLTLEIDRRAPEQTWRRVVVRPVEVHGRRHLQFSYFDARQDVTKNYAGGAATRQLDALLDLPARAVSIQSSHQTLNVQITKSGKAILHRLPTRPQGAPTTGDGVEAMPDASPATPATPTTPAQPTADLRHNRRKEHPLPDDVPDPLLQALGIMDEQGRVKAALRGKFTQVNEFLKLLEHTGVLDAPGGERLHLVDCASGSSYLSLAAYHYLNDVKGIPATLVGVDVNARLVAKSNALAETLGYDGIGFVTSTIAAYTPETPPDIVLALHACDTATDDALARAMAWGARVILAVPCCHHALNEQLQRIAPFGPVLHHGILKERLADILTDGFRAQLLRLAGYDTDVVEFVSTEHSGRNLMIRAVRPPAAPGPIPSEPLAADPPSPPGRVRGYQRLQAEYTALKQFWGVTPYLETLLRQPPCQPDVP